MTNNLFEKKWSVFERRVRLFRYVPFVKFVILAGSMAVGREHEESDFDVIVGTRDGRVWTTWFLSTVIFQLRGWREHPGPNKSNRIALTHFAAPEGYKLGPPYDTYRKGGYSWESLYRGMVPAFGNESEIARFFEMNDWLNPPRVYKRHEKYVGEYRSLAKSMMEWLLGGHFGNLFEKILSKWLVRRLKDPKKLGDKPRVFYDEHRIEIYRGK